MRYLLFDADQTILDFNRTERVSLDRLFSLYGIEENLITMEKYRTANKFCWDSVENKSMTLEKLESERWRLFFESIGREDLNAKEAAIYFGNELGSNGFLLPGAKEMLNSLSSYRKSLITNGIAHIQRSRLKDTQIENYFERVFISQEIGEVKPQKGFFDYVFSVLNISKKETVVIGDSETSDIKGAKNYGLDSIYLSFEGKKSNEATWSVSSYRELIELIKKLS